MKKILTTIAAMLLLSNSIFAQQQRPQLSPEEMAQRQTANAQRQTQEMKERLKLTDEQEKSISEINLKYAKLRTEAMQAAQSNRSNMQEITAELDKKRDEEILPLLNKDQVEPYHELKREQAQRRPQGGGGGRSR
jgi:Spy/CpxP family protein refolding chaperone